MSLKLYFAHIGKTGGTSVRKSALSYFGMNSCVTLYGEQMNSNTKGVVDAYFPVLRAKGKEEAVQSVLNFIYENKADFFSTHHNSDFAPHFPPEITATFVRNPVERIISHYNFWKKTGKWKDSFEEFVIDERTQNIQYKHLRTLDIGEIGVVGLTERYEESIILLNRYFRISLQSLHHNKTGWRSWFFNKNKLSKSLKNKIEEINDKDMAIYEMARTRFESDIKNT